MWEISWERISSRRPTFTRLPERMRATRSQSVSASGRMWVEKKIVRPCFLRSRMILRTR